jgi:hypothetical protein
MNIGGLRFQRITYTSRPAVKFLDPVNRARLYTNGKLVGRIPSV